MIRLLQGMEAAPTARPSPPPAGIGTRMARCVFWWRSAARRARRRVGQWAGRAIRPSRRISCRARAFYQRCSQGRFLGDDQQGRHKTRRRASGSGQLGQPVAARPAKRPRVLTASVCAPGRPTPQLIGPGSARPLASSTTARGAARRCGRWRCPAALRPAPRAVNSETGRSPAPSARRRLSRRSRPLWPRWPVHDDARGPMAPA